MGTISSGSAFYSVDVSVDGLTVVATGADKATSLYALDPKVCEFLPLFSCATNQ